MNGRHDGPKSRWSCHYTAGALAGLAARSLAERQIPSPEGEAWLLLAEATGHPVEWLAAHPDEHVGDSPADLFLGLVARRRDYEPVEYLLGRAEFLGLEFRVTPAVFIPRAETELLVNRALLAHRQLRESLGDEMLAVELGTGSGAIAVSMALHLPGARLVAVDISEQALEVARANAAAHGVDERIEFREGDLLEPVPEPFSLLVANLPYIPFPDSTAPAPGIRQHEPMIALDGGTGGTDLTAAAIRQASGRLARPAALLFEIGHGQGEKLAAIARDCFPAAQVRLIRDFAGFQRVLELRLDRD